MADSEYVTVEVKGLDQLQAKLEQLPEKVAKKYLRAAVRAGATVIKNAMAQLAPRQSGFEADHIDIRTRATRDALAMTATIGPNTKIVRPERVGKISKHGKTKGREWRQWTAVIVARFLEFGTSSHAKKPFLTQAFESNKQEALDAITEKLRDALKDVL